MSTFINVWEFKRSWSMQSARNKDTSTIITVTFRSLRNQAEVVTHFCCSWRELSGSTTFTPFHTDSQGHRTFSFSDTNLNSHHHPCHNLWSVTQFLKLWSFWKSSGSCCVWCVQSVPRFSVAVAILPGLLSPLAQSSRGHSCPEMQFSCLA